MVSLGPRARFSCLPPACRLAQARSPLASTYAPLSCAAAENMGCHGPWRSRGEGRQMRRRGGWKTGASDRGSYGEA